MRLSLGDRLRPGRWLGRPLGLLTLLAVLALLAGLAQTPPGSSVLRDTGLVGSPQTYTSLYFTDPGALPSTVPSGHVALTVSFSVHNASSSSNNYQWTIQVGQGNQQTPAASGTITVPPGGTKPQNSQLDTFCPSGDLQVVVRLAAPAESIDFRAACGG
jgi:hypothetical protein